MEQELQSLKQMAVAELSQAVDMEGLNDVRVKYLGKKGDPNQCVKRNGRAQREERAVGQIVNDIRSELEEIITTKGDGFKQAELARKLASEKIDVTVCPV